MALAVTIIKQTVMQNQLRMIFSVVPSGNYTTAVGGDTLNFLSATYPSGGVPNFTKSPKTVNISSQPSAASTSPSGYIYQFNLGTTPANGKMSVFQSAGSAAPLAELGTGAYPAGVTGDNIIGEAVFDLLQ